MRFLVFFCILLQVLDGAFTGYAITHSSLGLQVEGNPLVRYVIEHLGVVLGLIVVKSIASGFILHIRNSKDVFWILLGVCVFYTFVVSTWAAIIFSGKLP